MKLSESSPGRRLVLAGGAGAALAWLSRPWLKGTHAQQPPEARITAVKVEQVPVEPDHPSWGQVQPTTIALNPQNLVIPRLKEAGAKEIQVRALYDAERMGLLLEWKDAHKNADLGTVLQYRDAIAVQFPQDLAGPLPSYTMGDAGIPVTIYHWKSDWQFGPLQDVDEAYPNMYADWYQYSGVQAGEMAEASDYLVKGRKEYLTAAAAGNSLADPKVQEKIGPIQKMRAEGFGTIEPDQAQDAQGKGLWKDGGWRIVVSVPRKQPKFTFEDGLTVPLALAVWDGSRNERNGQKAFSQWNSLNVGATREGLGSTLALSLGGVGVAIVAALAIVFGLRLRRSRGERRT